MIYQRKLYGPVEKHLKNSEITLITGARQVGKTTLMKHLQAELDDNGKKTTFLNLEILETLDILNRNPENIWQFLDKGLKKQYLFLDEVQYLKNPSNFLKHIYDEYGEKLKLIVSGSSAFYIDQKFTDSLAGRKRLFVMRSLSFSEFLIFKNENDLASKAEKKLKLLLPEKNKIMNLFEEYMIYGGYPKVVLAQKGEKEEVLREIINSYLKKDIDEYGIRDPSNFLDFLRLLAGQAGSLFNQHEVCATLGIKLAQVKSFLKLLEKTFYIQAVAPFHKNLRKELTKMPKYYFLDLGVRNYLLKDFRSLSDRPDKGAVVEEAVFIELVNQYPDDRSIRFWRTQNQNEVDFVVDEEKAYEVKFDLGAFSPNKYKMWRDSYPQIPLKVVGLSGEKGKGCLYPWEV